ncbi:hypothetical protein PENTCL1PPCAC_7720 [Pristionchus entomophagus]|uniref:Uncharacterized protein n=1 Tax=Pristionchus entomophagus TaxID=358040 RepID=A0AAV5SW02_9BILA|nr:hypothetical protein PENTCL1PPCAC_7720 [Pristionchus entomophagus]
MSFFYFLTHIFHCERPFRDHSANCFSTLAKLLIPQYLLDSPFEWSNRAEIRFLQHDSRPIPDYLMAVSMLIIEYGNYNKRNTCINRLRDASLAAVGDECGETRIVGNY